jgi:hypothetical protein|tara:strand:+ start:300 stop:989 length:690 start_codon:yes stop_codon:yes gene_type:complete
MAKTVTTTDDGRECPSDAAIAAAGATVAKVGNGKFAVAYALEILVPRSVKHWRQRDGAKMSEKDIFQAIAATAGVDESANTLIQWRNVGAAFPKAVRVEGVSFGAHKALAPLAWKNDGARRSQICEWMATNKPTEAAAADHAKAMRLADSPPTDDGTGTDGDDTSLSAADVNGPAVTTITGAELYALVNQALAQHDGSEYPDGAASKRQVELLAAAYGWVATRKEDATV